MRTKFRITTQSMVKNKCGRPTKYSPDIIPQFEEYLKLTMKSGGLPTMEGLSIYIGVDTDTLVEWTKKHKAFSVARKKLMTHQRKKLIEDGLYGGRRVSTPMAIFLLKANHGMVETEKKILEGNAKLIIKSNVPRSK